ncbi:MAG: SPOR domain-containing protein [Pseudomonadota bacterium]
MADMYFGDDAGPGGVGASGLLTNLVNWAGAIVSVSLVVGLAIWGYQLAVRDVTGLPVIRALEGPMRVVPDEPGGEQMQHQGLAVNSVAADGSAAGPAERLVLAPDPLTLTDEDVAGTRPVPGDEAVGIEVTAVPKPVPAPAPSPGPDSAPAPAASDGEVLALVDELAADATPLAALSDSADTPETKSVIPESVYGVSFSPLPSPRPRGDRTAEAVAESVALAVTPGAVEVDADSIAADTRLVQFGVFASPEEARAAWRQLDQQFTNFLLDKQRVVEKAVAGGKTFYRLRAVGFDDLADARRFCSAFVAANEDCIPVMAR